MRQLALSRCASTWQAVVPQQADAVRVWLEGERGGASALLDGFKARVLKGGAAVEPPTRHLYATEWWPQPTLDA